MGRMYNHAPYTYRLSYINIYAIRRVTVLKLSGAALPDRSPEWLSTDSSFTALRGGARHHTRLPE